MSTLPDKLSQVPGRSEVMRYIWLNQMTWRVEGPSEIVAFWIFLPLRVMMLVMERSWAWTVTFSPGWTWERGDWRLQSS